MSQQEGVIKFTVRRKALQPDDNASAELRHYREKLFGMGLLGYDPNLNVGFGNVSQRLGSRKFIITGSQTGHIAPSTGKEYCLVTGWDLSGNQVDCEGLADASSETLSHASLYECSESIRAVFHVHAVLPWKKLMYKVPTTQETTGYGTVEMAMEIKRLFEEARLFQTGFLVMAGHEGGILAFGESLSAAFMTLKINLDKA